MKYLFLSLAVFALFSSCDDDNCINGSGQLEVYTLDVPEFDKIDVEGGIEMTFTQGDDQIVTLRAEPEIYEILDYSVSNRTLIIDFDNKCVGRSLGVEIDFTISDLRYVGASGALELDNTGDIDLTFLEIDISGSAEVELDGTCTEISYVCSGSIEVDNFGLETSITNIDVSGAGEFDVFCANKLNIDVSGAATVRYRGNPVINENVSGALDLKDAN